MSKFITVLELPGFRFHFCNDSGRSNKGKGRTGTVLINSSLWKEKVPAAAGL